MKKPMNRELWRAIAATVTLCSVLVLPVAGQPEEEEDTETIRLGQQLAAKLDSLDRKADELAKVKEGEKNINIGVGELQADLSSLADQSRKIEQHFEERGETGKARKAKELAVAVRPARAEVDKLGNDKSTPKSVAIALRKVVRVGREAGRACFVKSWS